MVFVNFLYALVPWLAQIETAGNQDMLGHGLDTPVF